MALDTFIAGRYTGGYNAVDVGLCDDNGFRLRSDTKAELLNATDAYAQSTIDWVYQGMDVFLSFNCKAYKPGSISPLWPYAGLGIMSSAAVPIGVLASDLAMAMVLSATAATPAANSPASLTASKSLLAPNNPAELMFTTKVRNVPIMLQLLPYNVSGTIKFFTTT